MTQFKPNNYQLTNEEALDYMYEKAGNVLFVYYDDIQDKITIDQIKEMNDLKMFAKVYYTYDSVNMVLLLRRDS